MMVNPAAVIFAKDPLTNTVSPFALIYVSRSNDQCRWNVWCKH